MQKEFDFQYLFLVMKFIILNFPNLFKNSVKGKTIIRRYVKISTYSREKGRRREKIRKDTYWIVGLVPGKQNNLYDKLL